MNLFFSLRQLENSEMESKCCGHPKLCSLSTMYTFLLGAIFIALSSSRILLVKYSANEVAFILKFLDNMFHVLMSQVTTVIITTVSVLVFDFRPSLEFFLEAPSVLLAIFIYNASKSQDLKYGHRQERIRDLSGHLWERSSGDGEELERLTKPKNTIESDEDTF
uniref:Solute carrier family 35 member A5 n=1 Tax=Molossus molossus TaxID=27622 RepID=A0A7J8I2S1_MOLMO|nr:solute carrier family 35 member A5 [Molossus molossus]